MKVKWISVALLMVLGVVAVADKDCDVGDASQCYDSLVHYEGLGFPLYGEDELELDETCRVINESFECVNSYVAACHGQEECDEECTEMITDIGVFSLNTGLRDLQAELCHPHSAIRETYLENYVCLEDNANKYASCHNDSQLSQEYMTNITDPHEAVNSRCCFFSWYQDCFTNITKDTCSVNATFFVSFSLHKLIGHIAQHLCNDNPIRCERPPLPPVDDLDQDKPDIIDNDIDNSIGRTSESASTLLRASIFHFLSTIIYLYIFKKLFH